MKRKCSMLIKAPEGGRRVTRSHNKGSSLKGVEEHAYMIGDEVVKNDSMRTGKNVNIANLLDNSCTESSRSLNANSPVQVGTGGHRNVSKSAQDSVKSRSGVKSQGKLTKNFGVHRKVFTKDVLPDGAALYYVVKGKKQLEGFKKDGGIFCSCCSTVVSASQFEIHAGYPSRRKPYDNIFTSNGLSLHKLAIEITRNDTSVKQNNDLCYTCEYGGDMLFCKTSPQASHIDHDFTKKAFDDQTVMICYQCEKEYHVGCLREQKMVDLKALPEGDWFCCEPCYCINSTLQMVIKMKELRLREAVINTVNKKSEQVLDMNRKHDIQFRLLKGSETTEATRKFISDAESILCDRFNPIADSTTASLDLIPQLVFGRPFKGQDYFGMHCAILMVNSVVVSTAIFRVFGEGIAEMPLVATKRDCERKGYFQLLFHCIEHLLAYLNVKNLVLPAADEAESYWKDRFGFKKLDLEQVRDYKKRYQRMMIFQETSILHKSITK